MKTQLFSIYDKLAQQCGPINHERNKATAIRSFMNEFKDRMDADDFELLWIGEYDHDTCKVTMKDVPEKVEFSLKEQFEKLAILKEKANESVRQGSDGTPR